MNSCKLYVYISSFYPLLRYDIISGFRELDRRCRASYPSAGINCILNGFSPNKSALGLKKWKGCMWKNRGCDQGLLRQSTAITGSCCQQKLLSLLQILPSKSHHVVALGNFLLCLRTSLVPNSTQARFQTGTVPISDSSCNPALASLRKCSEIAT